MAERSLEGETLQCSNTVNLDVESPRPRRHADEYARWWIDWEIPRIDRINRRELVHRRATDIALEHVRERAAIRLDAELQLLHHALGLALDGRIDHFASSRIKRWQARHIDRVAAARDDRGRAFQRARYVDGGSTRTIATAMVASEFQWSLLRHRGTTRARFVSLQYGASRIFDPPGPSFLLVLMVAPRFLQCAFATLDHVRQLRGHKRSASTVHESCDECV